MAKKLSVWIVEVWVEPAASKPGWVPARKMLEPDNKGSERYARLMQSWGHKTRIINREKWGDRA